MRGTRSAINMKLATYRTTGLDVVAGLQQAMSRQPDGDGAARPDQDAG